VKKKKKKKSGKSNKTQPYCNWWRNKSL